MVTVTAPVGTPVRLRIPGWATAARVCVGGGACVAAANGTFWLATQATPKATYSIDFAPVIRVDTSYSNGAAAVYRGALLYALQIGENVTTIATGPRGFDDHAVHGTSAWNYALLLDSLTFSRAGAPGPSPFGSVTQSISARARTVAAWQIFNNSATVPPPSPVDCGAAGACGAEESVTLVPFGATLLRVAVIPWVGA